jgi:muramoyltetrapeptide carboxypeptidase
MLTHLKNADVFKKISCIALGNFSNCHDPRASASGEYRQSIEDVLRERLGSLGLPVVGNFPIGHQGRNATLGIGARYRLDSENGTLEPMEALVTV